MSLLFFVSLVVSYCMDSPSILVSPSLYTTSTISATNLVATADPLTAEFTVSPDFVTTTDSFTSASFLPADFITSDFPAPIDFPTSTSSITFPESLATTINSSLHIDPLFADFSISSDIPPPTEFILSPDMPPVRTLAEFVEQAELAQTALKQFVAVQDFDNLEMVQSAVNQLMKTTVCFL